MKHYLVFCKPLTKNIFYTISNPLRLFNIGFQRGDDYISLYFGMFHLLIDLYTKRKAT